MKVGQVHCARCGARLARESRFCGECGATAEIDRTEARRIGRFVLGPIVGHGGMGVVHRAHDTDLGRDVALKLIAPSLAGDAGFRARFEAEARATAAVDHPNVLPVFEAGEDEGELYLAMRLVEGTDLKAMLARESTLTPVSAAKVIAQLAAALDAAHARNLIHRDVKPANVLISHSPGDERHVYLADFGLTQITDASSNLTNPGQVVGTANYIAPEQIEGRPLDGRVDVYALACVAFECLVGEPPFTRETPRATLMAHLHEDIPRASDRIPTLPAELDDALAGGLAKGPAERFASCGAFARALGTALGTGTGELPSDPRVAARARPRPDSTPIRQAPVQPVAADAATLVRELPPRRPRARSRSLVAVLALVAAGGLVAAAVALLPSLLGGEGGRGDNPDLSATIRVLGDAQTVNGELSALMSSLARDPTATAERDDQLRRLPALTEEVRRLLALARRGEVDPGAQPILVRALRGQERLLDQYRGVLTAEPADAQPLIDEMRTTLNRVETDLRLARGGPEA